MNSRRFLDHLPAIYRQDPASPGDPLIGRFLAPFEEVFGGVEDLLAEIDRYFAPGTTDAFTDADLGPDFLPWLATWVSLVLDPEWDEAKRRRLIDEAVELYRWRGTVRGLKRYLAIYTGVEPQIREGVWPGGMQIGVASRLGGLVSGAPVPAAIESFNRRTPVVEHDYYVVETRASAAEAAEHGLEAGDPLAIYYRADRVASLTRDAASRTVTVEPRDGPAVTHHPAIVTRRDGLIDDRYTLRPLTSLGEVLEEEEYFGDGFLVDEEERPYRFIVDLRLGAGEIDGVDLDKVRAIVDLEKPAHTLYSLRLTPIPTPLVTMRIEVRSTVEVDTLVG